MTPINAAVEFVQLPGALFLAAAILLGVVALVVELRAGGRP